MTAVMEQHPEIKLLACDYRVIYESGALKATVYKENTCRNAGPDYKIWIYQTFLYEPLSGLYLCGAARLFDAVKELWFDGSPHDEFLWLMAAVQDGAWFYNRVLMDYVRYSDNASGVRYKDVALQKKTCAISTNSFVPCNLLRQSTRMLCRQNAAKCLLRRRSGVQSGRSSWKRAVRSAGWHWHRGGGTTIHQETA